MSDCVIFDCDGTLFDTGDGIRDCARRSLADLCVAFPEEKLNMFIGPSLFYSFNSIVGLDEEQSKRGVEIYRKYYHKEGIDMSHPYDGIVELLTKLKSDGCAVTIASSKPVKMVEYLLSKYDMRKFFDKICAADFSTVSNDKSDMVKSASVGTRNIMVGDTHFDIEGAHKAGVKAIAAAYGFGARDTLAEADYVAYTPAEIYTCLAEVFGQK